MISSHELARWNERLSLAKVGAALWVIAVHAALDGIWVGSTQYARVIPQIQPSIPLGRPRRKVPERRSLERFICVESSFANGGI